MAGPAATGERERSPLPDRVTMPLLTLVTQEAIDEDYVHAAQRRAATHGATSTPEHTRLRGAVVVTILFGLLIALAAVQTARNKDVQQASRDALVERIDQRKKEVHTLEAQLRSLQRQDDGLRSTSARVQGQLAAATAELRTLQLSTGFVAVRGPGLRITVADSADGSAEGRVRASDLRLLVNGLWEAGAEAVAVNGRRLTNVAAIVNSNISIAVNQSPLTPPYVVSAIGDDGMGGRLQATTTDQQFQALTDQFGFRVDRQNEPQLDLPSAPDTELRLPYAGQEGGPANHQEDTP